MKTWQKILIIVVVIFIAIFGIALLSGGSDDDSVQGVYNGTGTDSFTYEIGYMYNDQMVYDNFTITVDTDGKWSVDYSDGSLNIWNDDNKTIKHVSVTKDGEEYAIDGMKKTEADVKNSHCLFDVLYAGPYATVELYE